MLGSSGTGSQLTWRTAFATRAGLLAVSLLVIEMLTAIQFFANAVVLPFAADELGGRSLYGVTLAGATASMFLTMPLAGPLFDRVGPSALLWVASPLFVGGGVLSAVAPTMAIFIAGRVVQGLASGILAPVAFGLLVKNLPKEWRSRLITLASASWVVPAIVGPTYASWATTALSWRWALVLFLPILLAARLAVASLARSREGRDPHSSSSVAIVPAVVLAVSMALVGSAAPIGPAGPLLALAGSAVAVGAFVRLSPPGVAKFAPGRPAAIALFFLTSFCYFAIDDVIAIVVGDVLAAPPFAVGIGLTTGALVWALTSIIRERYRSTHALSVSVDLRLGGGFICAGLAGITGALALPHGSWAVITVIGGWALASVGMGWLYPTLLASCLYEYQDGLPAGKAASAAVLTEAVGGALGGVLAATVLAGALGAGEYTKVPIIVFMAALTAVAGVIAVSRRGNSLQVEAGAEGTRQDEER